MTSDTSMESNKSIGVLTLSPMSMLERDLSRRYKLFRFWTYEDKKQFLVENGNSIHAVVGTSGIGADSELIDALPNLEIVSTLSVGFDKIDLVKCKERGIPVTNTPDVLTDDVADLVIGLILSVLRWIPQCDRFVKWTKIGDPVLYTKFNGKRVGIVGLGRIGEAIAERAKSFKCPISYHSRRKKAESEYTYYPNVIELATNNDILVVACALTSETRHIINRQVLDALGEKGVLINIGRGSHVDEPELVAALVEKRLRGAGLDVFEDEPNVPQKLYELDNVVLQPHVGSSTIESRIAMTNLVLANLNAHFTSAALLSKVA